MSIYNWVDNSGLQQIVKAKEPDYTANANAKTVSDPRFLSDLRQYYNDRGITYDNDADLVERWKSDNRWRENNIVSAGASLVRSQTQSNTQSEREARLHRVWEALPNFYEEGGSGLAGLTENLLAGVADPTNLIPGSAAAKAAFRASVPAAMAGQSAIRAGIAAGAKSGAIYDAATNAGVGGLMSLLDQQRGANIGVNPEGITVARTAIDAAASGVVGGVVGGAIGGITGGVTAARQGVPAADNLLARGFTPDDISRMDGAALDAAVASPDLAPARTQELQDAVGRATMDAATEQNVSSAALSSALEQNVGTAAMRAAAEDPATLARRQREDEMALLRNDLNSEVDMLNARLMEARQAGDEQAIARANAELQGAIDDVANLALFERAPTEIAQLRQRADALLAEMKKPEDRDRALAMLRAATELDSQHRVIIQRADPDQIATFLTQLRRKQEGANLDPVAEGQQATATQAAQKAADEQAAAQAAAITNPETPGVTSSAPGAAAAQPTPAAPQATAAAPAPQPEAAVATTPAGKGRSKGNTQQVSEDPTAQPNTAAAATPEAAPAAPVADATAPAPRRTFDARVLRTAFDLGVDPYKIDKPRPTIEDVKALRSKMDKDGVEFDADLDTRRKKLEEILDFYDKALEPFGPEFKDKFFGNKGLMRKIFEADQRSASEFERYFSMLEVERGSQATDLYMALAGAPKGVRSNAGDRTTDATVFKGAGLSAGRREIDAKASQEAGRAVYRHNFGRIQSMLRSGMSTSDGRTVTTASTGTLTGTRASRAADMPGFLEYPSRRFFDHTEALAVGRQLLEMNAKANLADIDAIDRRAGTMLTNYRKTLTTAINARPGLLKRMAESADPQKAARGRELLAAQQEFFDLTYRADRRNNRNPEQLVEEIVASKEPEFRRMAAARAEAMMKGREATGDYTIMRFQSEQPVRVGNGPDGKPQFASPGTPLFIDITDPNGFVYTELPTLLMVRRNLSAEQADATAKRFMGVAVITDEKGRSRPIQPAEHVERAINQFLQDGDLAAFHAVLTRYTPALKGEVPTITSRPGRASGKDAPAYLSIEGSAPLIEGNTIAHLVHKQTGEILAPSSVSRAANGTIEALLTGGRKGKLEDYDLVYVPTSMSRAERRDEARRIQIERQIDERLAEESGAPPTSAADAVLTAKAAGQVPQAVSYDTFAEKLIRPENDIEAQNIAAALAIANSSGTPINRDAIMAAAAAMRENGVPGRMVADAAQKLDMLPPKPRFDADGNAVYDDFVGWPATRDEYAIRVAALDALYSAVEKVAPGGITRSQFKPEHSIAELNRVFKSYDAATLKEAQDALKLVLTGRNTGPDLTMFNSIMGKYSADSGEIFLPNPAMANQGSPLVVKLLHELGHFAYENILTPRDKVEFWKSLSKFYDADGNLDREAIRNASPPTEAVSNSLVHPQELLANQFALVATGRVVPDPQTLSLWQRVTRAVQALFDWFLNRKPVDPDLLPTIAKMLPPDEAALYNITPAAKTRPEVPTNPERLAEMTEMHMAVDRGDVTKMQASLDFNFQRLGDLKSKWELADKTGTPDAWFEAAEETLSYLGASFKDRNWTETDKARASNPRNYVEASYVPYMRRGPGEPSIRKEDGSLYPSARSMVSNLLDILTQNGRATYDLNDPLQTTKRALGEWHSRPPREKERIAQQLRQLYLDGQDITPEAIAAAKDGNGPAVFIGALTGTDAKDTTFAMSSVSGLFEAMNARLEEFHRKTANRAPNKVPASVSRKVAVDPKAASIESDATIKSAADRQRPINILGRQPRLADLKTWANMSADDLVAALARATNDDEARPILYHLIQREAATPETPTPPAGATAEELTRLAKMNQTRLHQDYWSYAVGVFKDDDGNVVDMSKELALTRYEIQRRIAESRNRTDAQLPADSVALQAITERLDSMGTTAEVGVPPSAKPSVKRVTRAITHRDTPTQASSRTMAYRLLNLLGVTERGSSQPTLADIARLSGTRINAADAALPIADLGHDAFKALRGELRRIATSLGPKSKEDPTQIMQRIVTLAERTLPDAERELISSAGLTPADIAGYISGGAAINNNLRDRAVANSVVNLVERTAYISNGLLANTELRKAYPHLMLYGHMVSDGTDRPLSARFGSRQVPATLAPDYARELFATMPASYADNVVAFTRGSTTPHYLTSNAALPVAERFGQAFYVAEAPAIVSYADMASFNEWLAKQSVAKANRARTLVNDIEAIDQLIKAGEAGEKHLGSLLHQRGRKAAALERMGAPKEPTAEPVFVSVSSTANFDRSAAYMPTDAATSAILKALIDNKALTTEKVAGIVSKMPKTGMTGTAFHKLMSDAIGTGAGGRIADALRRVGYDSAVFDDGNGRRMAVFKPDAILSATDARFMRETPPGQMSTLGINGPLLDAIVNTKGGVPTTLAPVADTLEMSLKAHPVLTRAFEALSNMKGGKEDPDAIRQAWGMQLSSQSARLAKMGFHWLSGFAETIFPRINEQLGKLLTDPQTGLIHLIHSELGGATGVKKYLRSVATLASGGYYVPPQPDSHAKVVAALRRASGSEAERALDAKERKVYLALRDAMRTEFQKLRDAGVHIAGRGPDYFPQVWSKELIEADPDGFKSAAAQYFLIEQRALGNNVSDIDAASFADSTFSSMTRNTGDPTLVAQLGSPGGRGATADFDHSRVFSLDKYPEALPLMERFLEPSLEATVVKYFHQTTRRRLFVEQFGNLNRGVYDYLSVAAGGAPEIARLLETRMVFRNKQARTVDGIVYDRTDQLDFRMPFENRPDEANEFAKRLIAEFNSHGGPAARDRLLEVGRQSDGSIPAEYKARVDAIVAALNDFKGEPAKVDAGEFEFAEKAIRTFAGHGVSNEQRGMSQFSQGLRTFNSVSLLGFSMLSSFGDLLLPMVRSGEFGASVRAMRQYASDPDYRRMFQSLGVHMESILHEHMTQLQGSGMTNFGNAFFRVNGLTGWTELARKLSAAQGYEAFMAMQSKALRHYREGAALGEQHPEFKKAYRFLSAYGLGEYATKPGSLDISRLDEDALLRTAVIRFTDQAVFSPNPNDIPLWAQTPLGSIAFQLKSFPLMMGRLAKSVMIDDIGNFIEAARKDGIAGAKAEFPKSALFLVTFMPAMGMASLAARDIIQGRGGDENKEHSMRNRSFQDWLGFGNNKTDENDFLGWYMEGLMVAGGFGLLADLFHQTASSADNGAYGQMRVMSALLGPSVGTVADTLDVVGGAIDMLQDNGKPAKEREALRSILSRVPIVGAMPSIREPIVDEVAGFPLR